VHTRSELVRAALERASVVRQMLMRRRRWRPASEVLRATQGPRRGVRCCLRTPRRARAATTWLPVAGGIIP
jgi:hypothetical protein